MGKPIDSRALAILKKLNLDSKDEQGQYKALWDCHGTWVMYHRFIEQAGAENGIRYKYEEVETNSAKGKANHTPKTPILFDKINNKGTKKKPCLVKVKSKAGIALPMAWKYAAPIS